MAKARKKEKRVVPHAVAHVNATFNNTLVCISDPDGNVLTWSSSGRNGFKGSRKGTPFAAQVAAQAVGYQAKGPWRAVGRRAGQGAGRRSRIGSQSPAGHRLQHPIDP